MGSHIDVLLQEHDLKEHKHQLKAERRARKAAEAWLRSELKSRVSTPPGFNLAHQNERWCA